MLMLCAVIKPSVCKRIKGYGASIHDVRGGVTHPPQFGTEGGRTADIWIGSSALAANRTFRQQFSMFDVRFRLRSGAEQHTKLIHRHNLFIPSPNYRGEICADAYGQGDASKQARPATRASYFLFFMTP